MGLVKRFLQFLRCFTILILRISPEWLNRTTSNVADTLCDIWFTWTIFAGTIYDGFRIPWSSLKFVQLSLHNACAVDKSPQLTRKKLTLCNEQSGVCNALHQYIILIYHKLHLYCLYVYLTHTLQNIPPHSTGNVQLQQKHAHEAVLSEGVVHLTSPYASNWSSLHMHCEHHFFDRCKRLYAVFGEFFCFLGFSRYTPW